MKKVIGIISTAFGCFFLLFAIGMGVVFGLVGHGISGMKDDTDYSSNEYTSCIGTIVATESGDDKNTTISYEVTGTLYEKSYNIYSMRLSASDRFIFFIFIATTFFLYLSFNSVQRAFVSGAPGLAVFNKITKGFPAISHSSTILASASS